MYFSEDFGQKDCQTLTVATGRYVQFIIRTMDSTRVDGGTREGIALLITPWTAALGWANAHILASHFPHILFSTYHKLMPHDIARQLLR
jgi:hypothetical protein